MLNYGQQDQAAGLRRLMTGPKPRFVTVLSASSNGELPRILTSLAASFHRHGSDAVIVHAAGAGREALRHYQLAGLPTLTDVARGHAGLHAALRYSGQGYATAALAPAQSNGLLQPAPVRELTAAIEELARHYDLVLVEAALDQTQRLPLALLEEGEIIVQLDRKPSSIQQAYSLIKQLFTQLGARPFGIVVSGASEAQAAAVFQNIAAVAWRYLRLTLDFIGHIPPDAHLPPATKAYARGATETLPMPGAAQAFAALASRLDYRPQLAG